MNLDFRFKDHFRGGLIRTLFVLAACSKPESAAPVTPPLSDAPEGAATVAAQVALPKLDILPGMAYSEARDTLLQAGWKPGSLPPNGLNSNSAKVKAVCGGDVALCNAVPEVEVCVDSSEGECAMKWSSANGDQLRVTTIGGLASPHVKTFEILPRLAAPGPAAACPSQMFEIFLSAYRDSAAIQEAFSDKPLSMTSLDISSPGKVPLPISKNVDWVQVPKPTMLSVQALAAQGLDQVIEGSEDRYLVIETRAGTGIKKVYHFSMSKGCWHLTAIDDQSV